MHADKYYHYWLTSLMHTYYYNVLDGTMSWDYLLPETGEINLQN